MAITTTVSDFAAAYSGGNINLSWSAVSGATRYQIWYFINDGTTVNLLTATGCGHVRAAF